MSESTRPIDNRPALAALVMGLLSLPATITVYGGIVLGIAAIVVGFVGVSRSHRLVRSASAHPPQMSTTTRPSTLTQQAAPSSPASKLAANASRTALNAWS